MQIDMDNVINNWQYFAFFYYYSNGSQVMLTNTSTFTMAFPEEPQVIKGDVNNDGSVSIADVTQLIDYILGGDPTSVNLLAADVDNNGDIGVSDITALIDMILNGH